MDRRTILLVEDDSDELAIYTTLLAYHGYDVVTAESFDDGLRLARERRPDAAVVDVNLGEGQRDGCELASALRELPETTHIPVIIHTAFGDVYRRSLESAGCREIVHKPSNPNVLLRAVRRLLSEPTGEAEALGV